MAFSTPYSPRPPLPLPDRSPGSLVATVLGLLLALLLQLPAQAQEPGIRARDASYEYAGNRIELSARFEVKLKPNLEEALTNGFSLPFSYEFQLTRPRMAAWWSSLNNWFSPTAHLDYRLSYHSLSRQYRLHFGSFYRSFSSLSEALTALGVVRGWEVLKDSSLARDKEPIRGRIRLRIDASQLPKPLQLSALGNDDWELSSGWIELRHADAAEEATP